MKTIRIMITTVIIAIFSISMLTAQNNQFYRIHVDHVYPSSSDAYEKISKRLADLAKENKEKDGWSVLWTNDNRVISIAPVNGWADLGNPFMPNTLAKVGDKKFGEIFEEFDKHYDHHNDYIITLMTNLSYMPNGINTTPEGKNYRNNLVMYHKARDRQKIAEIAEKFKDLYTKKGSKLHYRVYFSGFGNEESYVMVARAAENALEYEKLAEANRQLLGEDGRKLWNELSQYITKLENIEGNMVPDLSYNPSKS